MPQQTNKDIAQVVPLTEFLDTVFAELSSHDNKWNPYEEGYGYFDNPDCWRETFIPFVVRLNKLAQTNITVYWWLLRQMSEIKVCKDGKKFLGKCDVFKTLLKIGLEQSGFILKNGLLDHVDELYEALKAKDLDAFINYMPFESNAAIIYSICRVLNRVGDVRNIYEDTMSHTEGNALGKLFLLFKRSYQYFARAYEDEPRSCDGMAKNIFLALYQTQFRIDKNVFSGVADRIGDLWVKSLMLTYLNDKDQIPQSVCGVMYDIFQKGEAAKVFKSLKNDFENYGPEAMVTSERGWLEMEKYSFIWKDVLDHEWRKPMPPFSCKIVGVRRRIVRGSERRDNCDTYIKSENAIPQIELLKHQNGGAKPFELIIVDNIAGNELTVKDASTNDDVNCPVDAVLAENQPVIEEIINRVDQLQTDSYSNPIEEQPKLPKQAAQTLSPQMSVSINRDGSKCVEEWPLPTDFFEPEYQDYSCPEEDFIPGFLSHKDLKVDFSLAPLKSTDEVGTRGWRIWMDYVQLSECFVGLIESIAEQGYIIDSH